MVGPVEVTSADQLSRVLRENKVVLLDVHAEAWCAPCRVLSTHIAQMASNPVNAGVAFVKMDVDKVVDQAGGLLSDLNVTAFPTVLLFVNGVQDGRVAGANVSGVQALIERGKKALVGGSGSAYSAAPPLPQEPMAYNS